MDDNIIEVSNLTKIYRIYDKPVDRLKESISLTKKSYSRDFFALNDISFSIKKGENIGIIGTNGSGKSTLLKIITGVLTQTSGEVLVNGKISALLELGAGFNPEYTGIENVYLNGTMMGFTKEEIDTKIESVISFADIGDFVNQPVKTYSSGMFARLAFAVAINVEPDILIVDEALSVGDMRFQLKCIEKMKEIQKNGVTILFVSHSVGQINRFCNKCLWIEKGNLKAFGKASYVTNLYENFLKFGENICKDDDLSVVKNSKEFLKPNDNSIMASITDVKINSQQFKLFDELEVVIEYEIYEEFIENFLVGVAIYTLNREYIFGPNTYLENIEVESNFGRHYVCYKIPKLMLISGKYTIDVGIFNNKGLVNFDYKQSIKSFEVVSDYVTEGMFYMENEWLVIQ